MRVVSATLSTLASTRILASYEHSVYRSGGAEEGAPLLILHGLLGQARNFRSWAAALAPALKTPRRVFTLDMRNHGESFHHEDMSYERMAEDVLRTMDSLGIEKAALLGHSMGGKVAMTCALKERDRVERLCVFDMAPVPYSTADGSNWRQNRELLTALRSLQPKHLVDRRSADRKLMQDVLDPNIRAFALSNLESSEDAGLTWKCNLDSLISNIDSIAGWQYHQEADDAPLPDQPTYEGPTLFLAGGNSRYVRSIHIPLISKTFPRYVLETIPKVGHWIHAEAPQPTLKSAARFLDYEDI